jgi:hypothetical protein
MIDIDFIKDHWAQDSKMDEDLLDHESIKIPQLHSKYLNWLSDVRLFKIKKEQEYKRLLREKFEYYTGKSDVQVYKEKPFDLKILKQDVQLYIEADEEIQSALNKLNYYKEMIFLLESILSNISTRGFQIKNSIDWQKFMQGSI